MKLEHLLLGVLLQHPSTGYDLKKYMDTHGRFLRSNTQMSQVYRSLGTMAERGWVNFDVQDRPGAQDAKVYRVSAEGETVFLDWLTGPYHPPTRFEDPELTARLAFAGFMGTASVVELLTTEIEAREHQVVQYRFRDRRLDVDPNEAFDAELAESVGEQLHRIGMAAIDAHIAAMTRLRSQVASRLGSAPEQRRSTERTVVR